VDYGIIRPRAVSLTVVDDTQPGAPAPYGYSLHVKFADGHWRAISFLNEATKEDVAAGLRKLAADLVSEV